MKKASKKNSSFAEAFKKRKTGGNFVDLDGLKRTVASDLEAELQQSRKRIEADAMKNAEDTSARLRPQEKGDSLRNYLEPIASKFGENESKIHKRLQTKGLGRHKEQVNEFKAQELEVLDSKKTKRENEIVNEERKLRTKYGDNPIIGKTSKFLIMLAVSLLGAELLYNSTAFQSLGFSFIKAAIIAFAVVVSLAILGYNFIDELKVEKSKRSIKKLWFFGILISLCFFAIAYLRVYYMNQIDNDQSMSIIMGTLVFVVINALIFGATSYIFHMFPTKQERLRYKKYLEEVEKLDEMKKEVTQIEAEESQLRDWAAKSNQEADDLIDYANELLKNNLACYRTVATEWKRETALRLPHISDCLEQDIPELTCELVLRNDDSLLPTKSINA